MNVTEPQPIADHALSQKLGQLGTPDIDAGFSQRVLRKARGELRQPGEGTLSLRGLTFAWDTALAPAVVLLGGALYTVGAVIQLAAIFVP